MGVRTTWLIPCLRKAGFSCGLRAGVKTFRLAGRRAPVRSAAARTHPPGSAPATPTSAASETVARIGGWKGPIVGQKQCGQFRANLAVPESPAEAQTLEKHRAPWRHIRRSTSDRTANALLQPLLGDLISAESLKSASPRTNRPIWPLPFGSTSTPSYGKPTSPPSSNP